MEANQTLAGKNVAVLIADGIEESEYTQPQAYFEHRGARFTAVAHKESGGLIQSYVRFDLGWQVPVATSLIGAKVADFDALLIPGGILSEVHLRLDGAAMAFLAAFGATDKTICATTHGPGVLIEAGLAVGHRIASCTSVADALRDAGAEWVSDGFVSDGNLITCCRQQECSAIGDAVSSRMLAGWSH